MMIGRVKGGAFLAGVLVFAAVKMAAIGVTTAATVEDVLSSPATFGTSIAFDVLSELVGAAILAAGTLLLFRRPRWSFAVAGGAQLLLSMAFYLARAYVPYEASVLFGASHPQGAWAVVFWYHLGWPDELVGAAGILIGSCVAAGVIAQTVHNMAVGPRVETPFQTRA